MEARGARCNAHAYDTHCYTHTCVCVCVCVCPCACLRARAQEHGSAHECAERVRQHSSCTDVARQVE